MKSESDEDYQEEQLTNIASAISEANFNVRHFRKQQLAKPLKIVTNHARTRAISRIFTDSHSQQHTAYDSAHSKTVPQGLHQSLKFQDTFIQPGMKKEHDYESKFKRRNLCVKSSDRYETRQNKLSKSLKGGSVEKKNSLRQHERTWSRGRVNDKFIEQWLNAICMEYFPNQYFDRNIPNSALKKLSIDENSLIAKGLNPKNVARLYNSLFVYAMGFNELVRQLTNGNLELAKVLWKIFSIVLQYCSRGSLETVVGQIERQNSLKLVDLSSELERKQMIIEKNEELNEKKNSEIFKEIKQLRLENINLQNQKSVLVDEYNSTSQAFSEQVGLRLKFESKINQIYGLHRELGNKHQKLYQELVVKAQELKVEADRYFEVASRISEYKEVQLDLRQQLTYFKQKSKRQSHYLEQSNREIVVLTEKLTKVQYELECTKNSLQEMKVKERQWEIERANMNVVVDMREKSTKETYKEYQITLQENNRLYISLSDQRKVMEQYEKDKKNFNTKIISILSENSYNKRKLEQRNKDYQLLEQRYAELSAQKEKLVHSNEDYAKNEESLNAYFEAVQKDIAQMRRLNLAQTEQLSNLRLFHANISKVLKEKNGTADNLVENNKKLAEENSNLKRQLSELQSQLILRTEKVEHLQQSFIAKENKLTMLREDLDCREEKWGQMVKQKEGELEALRGSLEKVVNEYKNQKFERSALHNAYMQALRIIENKNQDEKQLYVRLSLLEGDLNKERQKYIVLEKNTVNLIAEFSATEEQLAQALQQQRQTIYLRAQYLHPMIFEDLRAQISRHEQTNQTYRKRLSFLEETLLKEKALHSQQTERKQAEFRWELKKVRHEATRISEVLKDELTFQKQQNNKLKARLDELQIVADTYRKKISEKTSSEREQLYKYMLDQKKKQIQNLLLDIEKFQDQLAQAKKTIAEMTVAHSEEILTSQEGIRNTLEESLRKQLEHEFQLRIRDTQRSLRAQFNRKQQQLRQDKNISIMELSLQEILRIKNLQPEEVMEEIGQKMRMEHHGLTGNGYKSKGKYIGDRGRGGGQDLRKRQEISRLIKNAAQYYEK